jgi:hypothetical protein
MGAGLLDRSRTALATPRAVAVRDRLTRVGTSVPFLGLLVAVLTWPSPGLQPATGFDPSWGAGLHMAAKEGLAFGEEVVFTYGPLGFLQVPTLWYEDLGILAFLYTVGVHWTNCALLLWVARRYLDPVLAVLAAIVAASFLVPSVVITGALIAAAYVHRWLPQSLRRWFPVLAGGLVAFALLGKVNHGIEIFALAAVAMLADDWHDAARRLAALAATAAVALVAFWLALGQPLGALGDYLSLSREVISGHSEALTMAGPKDLTILAVALVTGLTAAAWLLGRARPTRERAVATGLVLLFGFFSFKEGFVRQDYGHESLFVAGAVTAWFLIDWGPRLRRLGVASLAVVLAVTFYFEPTSLNPIDRLTQARKDTSAMVQPGERQRLIDEARLAIGVNPPLEPAMVERIGDGSVHVGPYLAATVWAYGFEWRPLPVFQDYLAYTSELDDVNADALASEDAPDFILRHLDLGLPDHHYTGFNPPRATVELLCHYRPVLDSDLWTLLEHSVDRCGDERPLGRVEAEYGAPIPVPPAPPRSMVVARVAGVEVTGPESLRALLFRAKPRRVGFPGRTLLGKSEFRLLPGTANDGLLLRAPRSADLPGGFRLAPNAEAFVISGRSGPLDVEFFARTVTP